MTRPARACIHLSALQHNFKRVKQAAPDSKVMAIIKADAYGHGLLPVAQSLSAADAFGVASIEEAITLREAGFDRRIVLLEGAFAADELILIGGYRVDMVVHHQSQLQMLAQARLSHPVDVWLKLDTGMHRLGFPAATAAGVLEQLQGLAQVGSVYLMSHLACADDTDNPYTDAQLHSFRDATSSLPGETTLANSAAILAWPDACLDWVRPGIMLYGGSPLAGKTAQQLDLQPVMTLETRLIAVNEHRQGDAIGYGGDWVCPESMKIGVAAIGYGDGYSRQLPSGTPVRVAGQPAALAGRVSMDMICIDLRAVPMAAVGDSVTLWGDGLPVDEIAAAANTIAYELLCGVSQRVQRQYID
ncbi:MAG: alanine racemase [Pseudomonadota bacterium]